MEDLQKVTIKRIIGPTPQGAAVLIGNEKKTFAVFIGPYEAMAMIRELKKEKMPRPLTHDLVQHIFLGFGINIKKIIVSDLSDQTYFATLVLEKAEDKKNQKSSTERNEVRIDARPSDCFVLALKNKSDIFITQDVFNKVEDISSKTEQLLAFGAILDSTSPSGIEIPDGLGDELDIILGEDNSPPEDEGDNDVGKKGEDKPHKE